MAKKTTPRSKTEPKADSPKPRARTAAAKTTKPKTDKAVVKSKPARTSVSPSPEPGDEEIRIRAYHRYLERGGHHGTEFEDWLEARRDLLKR